MVGSSNQSVPDMAIARFCSGDLNDSGDHGPGSALLGLLRSLGRRFLGELLRHGVPWRFIPRRQLLPLNSGTRQWPLNSHFSNLLLNHQPSRCSLTSSYAKQSMPHASSCIYIYIHIICNIYIYIYYIDTGLSLSDLMYVCIYIYKT